MSSVIEIEQRTLSVTRTEDFDAAVAAELVEAWRSHTPTADPEVYMRKAAGDMIPQYIQFMSGILDWSGFKIVAIAFLSRAGFLVADDAVGWARSKWKSEDASSIEQLAKAIHAAHSKLSPPAKVLVALNLPDERWGTALELNASDPAQLARQLAIYAVSVGRIAKLVSEYCERGEGPLGQAQIVIREDDHIEVAWMSQRDFRRVQLILPAGAAKK